MNEFAEILQFADDTSIIVGGSRFDDISEVGSNIASTTFGFGYLLRLYLRFQTKYFIFILKILSSVKYKQYLHYMKYYFMLQNEYHY